MQFSLLNVKTICHLLWFDSQETCGLNETCIYHGLSSHTPSGYRAHTRGCGASPWLGAHYLLYKCCHLLPSKECCVYALAFPSQWTHLAFAADHPSGRFWLSKITFWVDYTLSAASSNYSFVLRFGPKEPQKQHGVHDASTVTGRIEASVTHSCVASSSNW